MFLGGAIGPPQELLRYIYENSGYPATPLQAITPNQLSIFLVCHVFNNLYIMLYNGERYVRSTNKVVVWNGISYDFVHLQLHAHEF
jgi:hypothetical protein